MTPMSAHLSRNLMRRTEYLIRRSALPGRTHFESEFLEPALTFARVGLIGGAIRDLAFQRSSYFKSDLDFVIEVHDRPAFERAMRCWAPEQTAFGGYRMNVGGLRVDFWEAKDSWANRHRHAVVSTLDDVRKCTFFNLDAVIFDVGSRRLLVDEDVLTAYKTRTLDINLRPNPNEDGAAVRALRRLWAFDLNASAALIDFIAHRISAAGWQSLVDRDARAFPQQPILDVVFKERPAPEAFVASMQDSSGRIPRLRQANFEFDSSVEPVAA
jgi:hypothetical protein